MKKDRVYRTCSMNVIDVNIKKYILEKLGSGKLGAGRRKMLILFRKNMVWKFTSQKVG
jgi:hypothetical protein